jgi:hypothetical protein
MGYVGTEPGIGETTSAMMQGSARVYDHWKSSILVESPHITWQLTGVGNGHTQRSRGIFALI